MNNKLKQIRSAILERLCSCGYSEVSWQEICGDTNDCMVSGIDANQLLRTIDHLNPHVLDQLKEKAIDRITNLGSSPTLDANRIFHEMLRDGVSCFYKEEGLEIGDNLKLLDSVHAKNNILQVCYDFDSAESSNICDLLLFINGLPLVILRIMNDSPLLYSSTLKETLLQYNDMPKVLLHNSLVIITNGDEVGIGAQFTRRENLVVWRTLADDNSATALDILKPEILVDFITNFISFSRRSRKFDGYNIRLNGNIDEKILGTYYHYYGVNKLIRSACESSKLIDDEDKGKLGVIGNTYGSMLTHCMLFYAGKLLKEASKINPTIVCVLRDIEAEDSFLQFLMKNRYLFGSNPVRAESATHLKELIAVSGGGIIVASIQKFYFDVSDKNIPLSRRHNIFVIMKGLNVCSYGSTISNTMNKKLAGKNFRERFLPNAGMACFVNITNASSDEEAFNLCGDYVNRYDMPTALRENVISKIYYEKRLTNYHIKELEISSQSKNGGEKISSMYWPSSRGWQLLEKKLGNDKRLDKMAWDIVNHFEQRHKISGGKAIIAVTSRQIAVSLYDKIIDLRPDWESSSLEKGNLKVLMTHDANDPLAWDKHKTTQQDRRLLRLRFGNPQDALNIVIVRDMWLSGLYEPCLHIMYWDKLLEGHMLMHVISRVNSIDDKKTAGLIVDYIGIERYLKLAIKDYLNKGGNDMVIMGTQ
nr:hypothetical protein [Gammaproteobacteria bacterium]